MVPKYWVDAPKKDLLFVIITSLSGDTQKYDQEGLYRFLLKYTLNYFQYLHMKLRDINSKSIAKCNQTLNSLRDQLNIVM